MPLSWGDTTIRSPVIMQAKVFRTTIALGCVTYYGEHLKYVDIQ